MAEAVVMPKLGLTMEEGTIVRWLKETGQRVEKGEPLLEVETDKSIVEVESPASGIVLRILAAAGVAVPIGQVIAYIGEEGEQVAETVTGEAGRPGNAVEAVPAAGEGASPEPQAKPQLPAGGRVKASPLARKLARQWGLDLSGVVGSGPGHRVVKKDVLRLREAPAPTVATGQPARPSGDLRPAVAGQDLAGVGLAGQPASGQKGLHREPVSKMRKVIADRMLYSVTHIPQFFVAQEVDMTRALALVKALGPEIERSHGVKLTVTDLLILVTARCLQKHRLLNAYYLAGDTLQDTFIEYHDFVNIGVAVALPDGLIVPVIPHVEEKGLPEIAAARADVVRKAREGRLGTAEMEGGTFTISNLGGMGIDHFQAIINPPEAGILAVGQVKKKPVAVDDAIAVRPVLELKLTSDHRLIDGAVAAAFLKDMAGLLEGVQLGVTWGQ